MTLYELTEQYQQLVDMAADADPEVLADTLEGIEGEIEDKADNYAKVIRSIAGDIESVQAEIDRLTTRKRTMENSVKRIKDSLQEAMIVTGKRKFKTPTFSFGIQKNPPSVQVKDFLSIPEQFWKPQDPVLDKTSLKNYLKEHGDQDYAGLVQTESLRIK